MANVNVKFNGKDFLLSCEDGQEEHLEELANNLNNKFEELKSDLGNIGENKLLLITAIKVMDEYFETKKVDKKTELENITSKFKELKSLVYGYKEQKEDEAEKLAGDINQLQNQIEEINKNYDQLISNATKEIEEFVEKVNLKTKLHSEQVIYQKKILNLRKKQHFNNSIDATK